MASRLLQSLASFVVPTAHGSSYCLPGALSALDPLYMEAGRPHTELPVFAAEVSRPGAQGGAKRKPQEKVNQTVRAKKRVVARGESALNAEEGEGGFNEMGCVGGMSQGSEDVRKRNDRNKKRRKRSRTADLIKTVGVRLSRSPLSSAALVLTVMFIPGSWTNVCHRRYGSVVSIRYSPIAWSRSKKEYRCLTCRCR